MQLNEKEVIDLYNEGVSTYQIAKDLNTYPNKIRRILHKNGIELKTRSEAQKNAIDKGLVNLPTKGKKRSKEEKIKISFGMKKAWVDMDEEMRNQYSERSRDRMINMPADQRRKMLEAAMKGVQTAGKEGSKLEKFLFTELTKVGYVVEFHKKNLIANQNLEIDLYVPSCKTIIEIDGPSHFLPIWGEEKFQKQIKADAAKTGLILSKGFVIIRIKTMTDRVSLASRQSARSILIEKLSSISKNFPGKTERYIEVEI
jgi:very-short-patch-repair endonuclease